MPSTALQKLAEENHGVLTRQQCLLGGMTRHQITTRVATGHWQRIHQGVFIVHSGPVQDETRLRAALEAVGPRAVVANETAIAVHLDKPLGPLVHIAVDTRSSVSTPAGVRVHFLKQISSAGVDPPKMKAEQALLETVHLASRQQLVIDTVCSVIGGRLTTPTRVLTSMSARPRQRWRKLLDDMLADVALGAMSPLELKDLANDRAHGLPAGDRQKQVRAGSDGRWLDVMVAIDGRPDLVVVKELDGRLGHEGAGRFRDMNRDNLATVALARSLRFGWTDLTVEQCEAAALQALLWRRLGLAKAGRACRLPDCGLEDRIARLDELHPLLALPA